MLGSWPRLRSGATGRTASAILFTHFSPLDSRVRRPWPNGYDCGLLPKRARVRSGRTSRGRRRHRGAASAKIKLPNPRLSRSPPLQRTSDLGAGPVQRFHSTQVRPVYSGVSRLCKDVHYKRNAHHFSNELNRFPLLHESRCGIIGSLAASGISGSGPRTPFASPRAQPHPL